MKESRTAAPMGTLGGVRLGGDRVDEPVTHGSAPPSRLARHDSGCAQQTRGPGAAGPHDATAA
ncbi:hypothetical protein ACFV23_18035 [Streptomyces sp. NPDC059627]